MGHGVISNVFRAIFHLCSALQFSYAVYYHYNYVKFPLDVPEQFKKVVDTAVSFGGIFKYFTVLNAIVQSFYYTLAFLNDLSGTNEHFPNDPPLIRQIKDYIFAALAFPLAFNVTISFWGLYAVDRELIFPKVIDEFFPTWLNHVYHTNITIFIVLELFITLREYPKRSKGINGLLVYLFAYLTFIHIGYFKSGNWVYPFLDVFPYPVRILFFIGNICYSILLYRLGEWLNNRIWESKLKNIEGKN